MKPISLLTLPFRLIRTIRKLNRLIDRSTVAIVHSNTIAVLTGAVWSWWYKKFHIWHVHEMIVQPRFIGKYLALLISVFSDHVVCNSSQTLSLLLSYKKNLSKKSSVVRNGIPDSTLDKPISDFRDKYNIDKDKILIILAGRINRWKGQRLLVDAFNKLNDMLKETATVIMLGDPPPGQNEFLEDLKSHISALRLQGYIKIIPFIKDVNSAWLACNICVVPSTEPEPFGLVAVEAMQWKKPVIAANHGGLSEIVIDDVTGKVFTPCDAIDLSTKLEFLLKNQVKCTEFGLEGRKRFKSEFTEEQFCKRFNELYKQFAEI